MTKLGKGKAQVGMLTVRTVTSPVTRRPRVVYPRSPTHRRTDPVGEAATAVCAERDMAVEYGVPYGHIRRATRRCATRGGSSPSTAGTFRRLNGVPYGQCVGEAGFCGS